LRINHADLEKAKYDEDVATEVGKGGQDTYAVFLGADLWFIEAAKMQRHAGRKNVLRKVRCGEKEDNRRTADPWAEIELVAIDAVRTGGCTYVALLFKDARNNTAEVKTQLIMVPEPADETAGSPQRSLRSAATHVSVVRAPDGDPGSLCVICGEGLNREVIFPFRETDGNMRPAAKVTAGASARGGSA